MSHFLSEIINATPVLIAGLLVYFGAREANKISARMSDVSAAEAQAKLDLVLVNFRQNWLQELRNEIAAVGALGKRYPDLDDEHKTEFEERVLRMLLLMNKDDIDFKELLDSAFKVKNKALGKKFKEEFFYKDFTEVGQRILKREWERLKGEIQEAKNYVENK